MSTLKVKNGNTWIEIPAGGQGVPSGGTTGQFLRKSNSTDYATEWSTVTLGDVSSEDVVPISKGGTGATTYVDANLALSSFYLGQSTDIPDNSDINNYTTAGTYRCPNGTTAATLINSPYPSTGFKLVVMYTLGPSRIVQIAYPTAYTHKIRYLDGSGWSPWVASVTTNQLPLSVANGGTGVTTVDDILGLLGLTGFHFKKTSVAASDTTQLTFATSNRGIIIAVGAGSNAKTAQLFNISSGGAASFNSFSMTNEASISMTNAGNSTVNVINNSSSAVTIIAIYT